MPSVDQPDLTYDELPDLDLTCPACSADLILDDTFLVTRVCGTCGRHFSMSARERIVLLVDPGTFSEFASPDPFGPDGPAPELVPSAERLATIRDRQVMTDAVITGSGRIGGIEAAIILLDDHLVGSSLGATLVGKIIDALGRALGRRLPIVLVCTGGARTPAPGPLAAVQPARLASAFAQIHVAGLPVLGVMVHPVALSIHAMLASHTDLLFAEPGVRVGSSGFHPGAAPAEVVQSVEQLVSSGWVDEVVDRRHLRQALLHALDLLVNPGTLRQPVRLGGRPTPGVFQGDLEAPSPFLAADQVAGAPHAALLEDVMVLRGDRVGDDAAGVSVGFGRLDSLSVAFATLSDVIPGDTAAAARKVARLARLASRQERPLLILVNESKSDSGPELDLAANHAVASLSSLLAVLPVPLVAVAFDLVSSPLALALFAADRQFLLANARLVSGVMETSAGGISHRVPNRSTSTGTTLSARECERLGLIDGIIDAPALVASGDASATILATRVAVASGLVELVGIGPRRLLDTRYRRQRELGLSTPDGLAAVRSELWEIHEWQRSLGRSLDDLRERWDHFRAGAPREAGRRIEVPDLVARLRSRRDDLLNRSARTDRGSPVPARRGDRLAASNSDEE
jgi:acetyl-CoA carboxylase carboxyl transferase subunit beta